MDRPDMVGVLRESASCDKLYQAIRFRSISNDTHWRPHVDPITSYMGWKVDFATPAGAPAYLPPDSVQWRVFKNPIALGVGGVAAVLLEFADPRIRSGVWDHSTYKADPIGRSRRTGMAAMVGVYGPKDAA